MDKDTFLKELASMTVKEINEIIESKGKKPNPVPLIIIVDRSKLSN